MFELQKEDKQRGTQHGWRFMKFQLANSRGYPDLDATGASARRISFLLSSSASGFGFRGERYARMDRRTAVWLRFD
jgi:hypothetical protein